MNMVLLYRKLVKFPVVNLDCKLNHALDTFLDFTREYPLAVLRDKDKVISQVIPGMCRRL